MPCQLGTICVFVAAICVSMAPVPSCAANRVYSIRADGSGLRVEVEADAIEKGMQYSAPHNSHDGTRLIFDLTPDVDADFDRTKLITLDIAGESKGRLEDLDFGKSGRWSPDGKRIVFSMYDQNPKGFQPGIWVMNSDGTNSEWLADGRWPQWTPDGKSVITKNYGPNGVFLLKVDIETKEGTPFLADYNPQWQIHWAPDGKRLLAYLIEEDESMRLVTMNADGAKDSIIELAIGKDIWNLGYSPDGKHIFYTRRNERGESDIYVTAANDKSQTRKLDLPPKILKDHFCWMSDGERIIFCAQNSLKVDGE